MRSNKKNSSLNIIFKNKKLKDKHNSSMTMLFINEKLLNKNNISVNIVFINGSHMICKLLVLLIFL